MSVQWHHSNTSPTLHLAPVHRRVDLADDLDERSLHRLALLLGRAVVVVALESRVLRSREVAAADRERPHPGERRLRLPERRVRLRTVLDPRARLDAAILLRRVVPVPCAR